MSFPKAKCMICNHVLQLVNKHESFKKDIINNYLNNEINKKQWYCCPVDKDPHYFCKVKNKSKNFSYGGSIYTKKYIICSISEYWELNDFNRKITVFKRPTQDTNFKIWASCDFYDLERNLNISDLIDFKNADEIIDNLLILD